ncbi:MAG: hypothetical protein CMC55_00150 [Flavobacteriaceae bacterium]|nr:hypothetical protein [Flavobacteriaceae bacterium]
MIKMKSLLKAKSKGLGKEKGTTIKQLPQIKVSKSGKEYLKSLIRDRGRLALPSGKRISKTGKVYWETRINRSDAIGSRV